MLLLPRGVSYRLYCDHWILAVFDASTYLAITSIAVIGTVHVFCVSFLPEIPDPSRLAF